MHLSRDGLSILGPVDIMVPTRTKKESCQRLPNGQFGKPSKVLSQSQPLETSAPSSKDPSIIPSQCTLKDSISSSGAAARIDGSNAAIPAQHTPKEPPSRAEFSAERSQASEQRPFLFDNPPLAVLAVDRSTTVSPSPPPGPARPSVASSSKQAFTQSQFSLALALTKSRLQNASASDYIHQLRKRVKTTSSHSVHDAERRYIDSAEFWKDQYTKLHEEKKDLQDKVHRREEELRLLRLAQDQDDLDIQPTIPQLISQYSNMPFTRKRKEPPSDDSLSDLNSASMWNEEEMFMAPADMHLLRMSSFLVRLGREKKNLDKSNERLQDPDHHGEVLKQVNSLLALLENAMCDSCMPLKLYNDKAELQNPQTFKLLRQVTWQVNIAFQSCFTTLNGICRTIPGRAKMGPIIYGMVSFVKRALALLHNLTKIQAEHQKIVGLSQRPEEAKPEEYVVNVYLTWTITSIILGLNWEANKPGHSELMEGIMSTVLEHTGRLVSIASFGEHIAASKNKGSKVNKTPTIDTTSIESLYMVQILYAALGGADKKELFLKIITAGRTASKASGQHKGMQVLDKAKHLLQSTLLKYTLGTEHLESLRMPDPPAEKVDLEMVEYKGEEDSKDWLVSMVTSLVGWDLVLPK